MVGQDEDETPLTRTPPSVTQETKARFESLLNAALIKTEMSKNAGRPPLPRPRNKKLKRKKLRHLSGFGDNISPSEDESQSVKSTASEESSLSSINKLNRNQIIFAAEVHNNHINSSKECLVKDNADVLTYISATSEDDVLTVKTKVKPPKIIPRRLKSSDKDNNDSNNQNCDSDVNGSNEKAEKRSENVSIFDDNKGVSESTTKSLKENSSNGITSDKYNDNTMIPVHSTYDRCDDDNKNKEQFNSNDNKTNSTPVKTPVPLPRRNKSKPSSASSDVNSPNSIRSSTLSNGINENKDDVVAKINATKVEVINEIKKTISSKFTEKSSFMPEKINVFSSSNEIDNDEDGVSVKKKRAKKKKKIRKKNSHDGDEMELAEMGRSGSATTTSTSINTLKKKTDISEHTFSRKQSVPDDNIMFGITVHGTDMLQSHVLLRHPMARVYIVDVTTGQYLKKSDPERPASFCDEHVDYILPIMTYPYDFKKHRCFLPTWEEVLIFNENMSHIVKPDTVVFFEIVDFVNLTMGSLRYDRMGPDSGWHYVAWAFLKLVAVNGDLNTEKKLRLQLYKPKNKFNTSRKATVPMVYNWWKEGLSTCIKYRSTLYVTVGRVTPPSVPLTPSLRSRVVLQNEQGSAASIASTSAAQTDVDDYDEKDNEIVDDSKVRSSAKRNRPVPVVWSRLPTQSCKLTNNKFIDVPIMPSGGFSLRFSFNGLRLAVGTASGILIFGVPKFKKPLVLSGHQGLVYTIRWSVDDICFVSSSSDCTACIWDIRKKSPAPQVLAHPSFVYCADFVPHFIRRIVITGCCDNAIRVWVRNKPAPFHLAQELTGHSGFVNALCFSSDGITFYSGDSIGDIKMWQFDHESGEWSCARDIKIREIRGVVINNLLLHPGGNRMLIHTRDSTLRMIDIPTYAVIQWFHGCCNERIQMSSCLTPCGGMVLSCSEDGLLCVWDCNTGSQLGLYNGLIKPACSAAVAYHPHEHMMAVVYYHPDSTSQLQSLVIYNYDRSSSGLNVGLKIFETNEKLTNKYLKENSKLLEFGKEEISDDIWKKLENLSTQRSSGLPSSNATQNIYTSTPKKTEYFDNNVSSSRSIITGNYKKYNHNSGDINERRRKKKRLLLDKKDNTWSKLSKAGGYLIEKSIASNNANNGVVNNGFEDDLPQQKSATTIFSSNFSDSNIYGSGYNDKLADIIYRMDKVLLNANTKLS